jgi:hypothetical protein
MDDLEKKVNDFMGTSYLINDLLNEVKKLRELRKIVDAQAEDEGLWCIAETAPEAYLQQELRRLHSVIEGLCGAGQIISLDKPKQI